jgi:hypothetical protein
LDSEAEDPKKQADWIRTNQGVGVVITALIVALLVYLIQQEWVFVELRDGFRLGFFTILATFTMLFCSVALIFDGYKRDSNKKMTAMNRQDFIIPGIVVVVCYIYFKLAWAFDFLLVTPVFLAVAIYVLGIRSLRKTIIYGVIITVTLFGLFRLIGIYLPSHIIPA